MVGGDSNRGNPSQAAHSVRQLKLSKVISGRRLLLAMSQRQDRFRCYFRIDIVFISGPDKPLQTLLNLTKLLKKRITLVTNNFLRNSFREYILDTE